MVLITSNHNKFDNNGNRLSVSSAKTIKPDHTVSDGPYTEIKEFIQGYIIVRTADIGQANNYNPERISTSNMTPSDIVNNTTI